jgi:DNA modification methylase
MSILILQADARHLPLADGSVNCCVTSPPYFGLRDYGTGAQIGMEETPEAYVAEMVAVFREVRRVLRDDGTLWLNLGDSYANDGKWGGSSGGKHVKALHGGTGIGRGKKTTGLKPKDLIGIPWMVVFALRADGWYLRSDIIWAKPNPMPESIIDRPTKAHEYMFLLSKSARYYYDAEAVKEPAIHAGRVVRASGGAAKNAAQGFEDRTKAGFTLHDTAVGDGRNRRSVWTVASQPYKGAHFAVMPPALAEPCILAGCPEGGVVLDPFAGSGTVGRGTVGRVGVKHRRRAILCDLNRDYLTGCTIERTSGVQVEMRLTA